MAASGFKSGKLLRIFVDESDRSGMQPTYCAVVDLLRKRGIAGATVFRGIEGYGSHNQIHLAKTFAWNQNMPILVEVVDDWERLEPLLPELQALVGEGLLTVEAAEYLRVQRPPRSGREPVS
jgi:PII-like signaling protein